MTEESQVKFSKPHFSDTPLRTILPTREQPQDSIFRPSVESLILSGRSPFRGELVEGQGSLNGFPFYSNGILTHIDPYSELREEVKALEVKVNNLESQQSRRKSELTRLRRKDRQHTKEKAEWLKEKRRLNLQNSKLAWALRECQDASLQTSEVVEDEPYWGWSKQ